MIFLDNNATTEVLPEVKEAILRTLNLGPANPSSPHSAGDLARQVVAASRDSVAQLIGASSEEIFFTSSGTEANNWALNLVLARPNRHLLITPIEHESVLRKAEYLAAQGVTFEELPVDQNGIVTEDAFPLINEDVGLVSVQWVNNITGVIQPIERISSLCRERGVLFHTDAAQAVGKLYIDVRKNTVNYLTFTGHKIHGPMGIGVLYRRLDSQISPLLAGGIQESGQRPGSENLLGIAGIAAAAQIREKRLFATQVFLTNMRDHFESQILARCPGTCVNTNPLIARVCNTTNIRFPDVEGEALLAGLIRADICCSQGSACTSQIPEPSHTLLAMGMSHEAAYQSIRFSFSELNTMDEVEQAVGIIASEYRRVKQSSGKGDSYRTAGSVG